EGRVEEGERQRHADRARRSVLAGGEFGDVADRSFDEVLEPGPSARDAPDQPVPFVRLHGATERGRGAWFEKRPSHSRSRFDPGDRQRFGLASVLRVSAIGDLEAIAQHDYPDEMRINQLRSPDSLIAPSAAVAQMKSGMSPDRSSQRRSIFP